MTAGVIETTTKLCFNIPLIPPSVNHYKKPTGRGGWFVTPEARAFIDAVCLISRKEPVAGKFYQIHICYGIPREKFLRLDVDNLQKVALDALTTAGVIRDDRYVVDLHLSKREAPDFSTSYIVEGYGL